MDEKDLFLKYCEKEAPATRNVLARIPEGSSYRPDAKSRTEREIAWLIVREEIRLVDGLEKGAIEWSEVPPPATMAAVLKEYDQHHETRSKRLKAIPAARWEGKLPFKFGDQIVMSDPGGETAWGFLLDIIHHRGQISTYLRAMGSTVPQIYGPSADEPM